MPGELKPCPFCGSTDLRTMRGIGYRNHTMVKCEGCGARSGCYLREDNCHLQWNRRADIAESLDTSTNMPSAPCCDYDACGSPAVVHLCEEHFNRVQRSTAHIG
jgi:Lar family restriction alleviation protein